ncbi:DNA polymerase III subunit alpha [Motiliproteus sp. MSK22-1]|uniref:DNA polymerase III subunit alpha n=1 Tax=Motiliproteus sp. MSK22-1 TaxID=1897630 RepID=UPI000977FE1E|nr:DNA polymerase III subunit alpha [Motiliproteus sp. MSK22-1]OMH39172.1 DNA polymerase III subunit alpha [Motiliproteus sp. MSK22-1]
MTTSSEPRFVHLKTHSEYSIVDGLVRIKGLVKAAAEDQMPAVALTDQVNFYALIKFYQAAMGAGLKPICGADLWIQNRQDIDEAPTRLTLLVMNSEGYRNLTELIARAYQDGQGMMPEKAVVKMEWVARQSDGLIALSGAKEGEVGRALLGNKPELAETVLKEWEALFPGRFYLELQRTGRANDEECLHGSLELASRLQIPVVATNDVVFMNPEDFAAHEARVCINQGRVLIDPRRPKDYSDQQYFRSQAEMVELFEDIPEALANTLEIAKRCNIEIELGKYYLPAYPIPDGMTMDEFFIDVSKKGLEERLDVILDKNDPDYAEKRKPYDERLDFELKIIIEMGFPGYFLIVMDFIQWGKDNGVPVGPGRGSGAGSLVAYCQKITDLDPLEYDLLFERFLNPERVSMPDFDIDFCMDNRDKVIDYVAETYGRDAVSQIITFGTMAAKAVVRDVARVQGKAFGLADKLSKLIPFEIGITLKKAVEQEPALREFIDGSEEVQEIMEMAYKLEGVTRGVGKHAGGVVIAPTRLTDFAPLYCDEAGHGLVTQFDKNDVEAAGLVKFDFLGLRTLTIIDWALKTIHRQQAKRGEDLLDITTIYLEDTAVYEMLKRGDTTAVFQLESSGMKDLMKRLLPSRFEDIVALVALFRPGPLQSGMVDDFINRKHGRAKLSYPHPDYEYMPLQSVLEPTYGVVLYQEQVMQIAQVMAGFSLGGADMLRRAMGKKKPEEMAKQRVGFLEGCKGNGIDPDLAGNIFDLVEKFAGYGFNKSHSAAYALVSYQTAWLKWHYPAPFMAAVMSSDMQNTDKVVIFIEECRTMKLPLVLPDVNYGEYMFTVNDAGEIVYGLGAVKGVGEGPIDAIVAARANGPEFKDLFDFCDRVGVKNINKRVLEALVRCGALDRLGESRAVLMAAIPDAVKAADQNARNQDSGIVDLFGGIVDSVEEDTSNVYEAYLGVPEWSDKERLNGEKDTLGLYVTGHPIEEYEKELRKFVPNRLVDLKPAPRQTQKMAGLVIDVRLRKTKRGDTLAFVTLDDRSARMEVTLFGDIYEQYRELVAKDTVLIVEGEVAHDDYSGMVKVRASRIFDIVGARRCFANCLEVEIGAGGYEDSQGKLLFDLSTWLESSRGEGVPVRIRYKRTDAVADINLGTDWKVLVSDELMLSLQRLYGKQQVRLLY